MLDQDVDQEKPTNSTVPVLEGMDCLEPIVQYGCQNKSKMLVVLSLYHLVKRRS